MQEAPRYAFDQSRDAPRRVDNMPDFGSRWPPTTDGVVPPERRAALQQQTQGNDVLGGDGYGSQGVANNSGGALNMAGTTS